MKVATFILVIFSFHIASSANILFFWGFSGVSHRITVWPLVQALADKGHKITFFSPYPAKKPVVHPNITEFIIENLLEKSGMDFDPAAVRISGGVKAVDAMWPEFIEMGVTLCEFLIKDQKTMNWLKSASFDLVYVNALFNECGYGFAHKLKAKTILYGTSSLFPWWGETFGFPEENYPEFHYHMPLKMTFLQQVWNTFTPLYWHYHRNWNYMPRVEKILRDGLNLSDMPSILEMEQNNSLILYNSHFSEEFPRSLPPWIVPVGGMHVSGNTKPLQENIEKFINSWEEGFIYFSFGTFLRLPLLPQSHKDAIFGAIRKFPKIGFVMKWNGGEVPNNIPDNVLPAEWLSQQDILSHPKIRAFIAHGGLLGTQEAVYFAVPMLVFPMFAEQDYNAERIQGAGRGLKLEISELTEDKLENAIREILTNKKYKENTDLVSARFKDRITSAVDTAVWWTEYVLRYKDTTFLRPIGVTRTWFERRMLHIWGFVGLSALISAIVLITILRMLPGILFRSEQATGKQKMKKHQ